MTIAACYVTPEGIVLGSDSTSTIPLDDGSVHFFNHGQKLFEVGESGTIGIVTWGMGGLAARSHRSVIADIVDEFGLISPQSIEIAASKFSKMFWHEYDSASHVQPQKTRFKDLASRQSFGSGADNARTEEEEIELNNLLNNLTVGFCIGGYVKNNRKPAAYTVLFTPLLTDIPTPTLVPHGPQFWGAPVMIYRLLLGFDLRLISEFKNSPLWSGQDADLIALLNKYKNDHGLLPIRDAIDFVHTGIFSTIKAYKFSNMPQICGGPIELAVITTDRPFRWVKHKAWDSAILAEE